MEDVQNSIRFYSRGELGVIMFGFDPHSHAGKNITAQFPSQMSVGSAGSRCQSRDAYRSFARGFTASHERSMARILSSSQTDCAFDD